MCPRINDTAFTPPRGFRYGTYSQQTNHHHPHLYKLGTTPCGLPCFPARPPRRRTRMAPFSAARPGAAGRPAGAPRPRRGSGTSRRGPSSWRPRFPACGRTAPPIIESGSPRSGDRDAVQRMRMDTGREGMREGKGRERMDARMDANGGIRVDEDEWGGEGGTPVSRTVAPARVRGRVKTRNPPGARGGSTGGNRIV